MDLQLLPAVPNDAPLLTIIAIASKGYWEYSEEELVSWIPDLMVFDEAIEKHTVYKLQKKKETIGFYMLQETEDSIAILEFLFILPQFIGKGYGSILLKHAIQKAKEVAMRFIQVLSDPNAEGFYTNFGFKNIGKKQSNIPDRYLPIMLLDL